jgi:hypothetical protein
MNPGNCAVVETISSRKQPVGSPPALPGDSRGFDRSGGRMANRGLGGIVLPGYRTRAEAVSGSRAEAC